MEKTLNFLKGHKNVAFATVEDNKPKIRVMQIMKQEGTIFYFATSKEKDVSKQLMKNPNVEFISMGGDVSVRVAGKVFHDIPENIKQEIYDNNPVLQRFHKTYTTISYFGISSDKIDYYDLSTNPVTHQSFSLT